MFFGWKLATPATRLSVAETSSVSLRSCGHHCGGWLSDSRRTSREAGGSLPVDVGEADKKVLGR